MSKRLFSAVAISLALLSLPVVCAAQGDRYHQMQQRRPSAKQIAEAQSKRMAKELNLSEKQYKQVYSLNLEEQNLRERLMKSGPMGPRPDGTGPGMGGPGMGGPGGPGMGGPGGPGMGRPDMRGPGNGGPGMGAQGNGGPRRDNQGAAGPGKDFSGKGQPGMGPHNGRPQMTDIEDHAEMQKFRQKKEKKLRKILTKEQFDRWEAMEARRGF